LLLAVTCSKDENGDIQHFSNSDVYPILNESGPSDPAWSPDMSTIVYSYLANIWSITPEGTEEPVQVTSMAGTELYPEWSPAAGENKIVFINTDGSSYKIYTLSPGAGEPEEVASFTSQIAWTSWSNDGEYIIFTKVGKKAIYRVPAAGGEAVLIENTEGWQTVEVAQASPARNVVIFVDQAEGAVRINEISVQGGAPKNIISFRNTPEHPSALAESHDGTMVAYATPFETTWNENIIFVPSAGGNVIPVTDFYNDQPKNPSWASDGKRLVIQMPNGIYMVEVKL
ncbi:TolB family protein, partial [candidate division KSB1 bacterium]